MIAQLLLLMYPYMDHVYPEWLASLSKEELFELEWRLRIVFEKSDDIHGKEIHQAVVQEYNRRNRC